MTLSSGACCTTMRWQHGYAKTSASRLRTSACRAVLTPLAPSACAIYWAWICGSCFSLRTGACCTTMHWLLGYAITSGSRLGASASCRAVLTPLAPTTLTIYSYFAFLCTIIVTIFIVVIIAISSVCWQSVARIRSQNSCTAGFRTTSQHISCI